MLEMQSNLDIETNTSALKNKDLSAYKNKFLDLEDNVKNKNKLNNVLQSLKENKNFSKFSNIWNSFSEKDKIEIYKEGSNAFELTWWIKQNLKMINPLKSPIRSPLIRMFQKESIKNQITKDSFGMISSAIRVFVHFWILNKPENLKKEDLIKNITKDEKHLNTQINILEKIAMVIPELKPALPIIKKIKPIVKISSGIWKEIMLESHKISV